MIMKRIKIDDWKYLTSASYRNEMEKKRQRWEKRAKAKKKKLSPFLEYENSPKEGLEAWLNASIELQNSKKPLPTRKEILNKWAFNSFICLLAVCFLIAIPIVELKNKVLK